MNSFVVELLQHHEAPPQPPMLDMWDDDGGDMYRSRAWVRGPRHHSERALEGYCAMHHLLLAIARQLPEVIDLAKRRVREFTSSDAARHKSTCPNLGELLVLAALVDELDWPSFAFPYLLESFDRNVRWYLRDQPVLGRGLSDGPHRMPTMKRLTLTYAATKTSTRLICFQSFFINQIARNESGWEGALRTYDRHLGKPTKTQVERLQRECGCIMQLPFWPDVFRRIGVAVPSVEALDNVFRTSVANSARRGYHQERYR